MANEWHHIGSMHSGFGKYCLEPSSAYSSEEIYEFYYLYSQFPRKVINLNFASKFSHRLQWTHFIVSFHTRNNFIAFRYKVRTDSTVLLQSSFQPWYGCFSVLGVGCYMNFHGCYLCLNLIVGNRKHPRTIISQRGPAMAFYRRHKHQNHGFSSAEGLSARREHCPAFYNRTTLCIAR